MEVESPLFIKESSLPRDHAIHFHVSESECIFIPSWPPSQAISPHIQPLHAAPTHGFISPPTPYPTPPNPQGPGIRQLAQDRVFCPNVLEVT